MDNNNSADMSNFMNNLNGMLENENIKNLLNNIKNNNNSTNTDTSNGSSNKNDSASSNINPEMLNNIMNMFNNSNNSGNNSNSFNNSNSSDNTSSTPNIDMEMLLKMKSIMEKMNSNKNDPRSNLLLSLKPYLKESRKNKVEQYIQLFNMSKVMEVLNPNGGEKLK